MNTMAHWKWRGTFLHDTPLTYFGHCGICTVLFILITDVMAVHGYVTKIPRSISSDYEWSENTQLYTGLTCSPFKLLWSIFIYIYFAGAVLPLSCCIILWFHSFFRFPVNLRNRINLAINRYFVLNLTTLLAVSWTAEKSGSGKELRDLQVKLR